MTGRGRAETNSGCVRRGAECELHRPSHEECHVIYDAISAGVVVQNAAGEITGANPVACEILGMTEEDLRGRTSHDPLWEIRREDGSSLPGEEHPAMVALRTGKPVRDFVMGLFAERGQATRWIQVSAEPILEPRSGEAVEVVSTFVDITARKQAEERFRLTRFIIDQASESVFWMDSTGRFRYVNEATCKSLGYSREELLALRLPDIAPEVPPESFTARWDELRALGSSTFETIHRRKDGRVFPVEITATHVQSRGEEYFLGFARDITERKRAEEALSESDRRMQGIFDSAPFGVFIFELSADGRLILVQASPSASRILGIDTSALVGKTLEEAFPSAAEENFPEVFRRIAREGTRYEQESVPYEEGSIKGVFQITAFQPSPNRIAVFFRDVTERTRMNEIRRRLQRQLEERKRRFYRETIFSVTGGKLDIRDAFDIRRFTRNPDFCLDLGDASQLHQARGEIEGFCREAGLRGEPLSLFLLGVGEAIANAVKHGVRGRVCAGKEADSVWVSVSDHGKGIKSLILPRAVLMRGFSTKPSMGLGYSIMIEVADRILLKTGKQGTTVVLVKSLRPAPSEISLESLPDTWGAVA